MERGGLSRILYRDLGGGKNPKRETLRRLVPSAGLDGSYPVPLLEKKTLGLV